MAALGFEGTGKREFGGVHGERFNLRESNRRKSQRQQTCDASVIIKSMNTVESNTCETNHKIPPPQYT